MLDRIRRIPGRKLDLATYHALRREETQHLSRPIWKLERAQYFHEPDDDPSWRTSGTRQERRFHEILDKEYMRAQPVPTTGALPSAPLVPHKATAKERLLWLSLGAATAALCRALHRRLTS